MSESTLAALAAVGAPLLKEAEQALAPEAEKVLTDLRKFVSGEADKLRTEFPAVVENGVQHLQNLAEAMLGRYHSVMERIDAHLGGSVPAPVPTQPAESSSAPSTSSAPSSSPSTGASDTSSPVVVGEPGPEAPAPTTDSPAV